MRRQLGPRDLGLRLRRRGGSGGCRRLRPRGGRPVRLLEALLSRVAIGRLTARSAAGERNLRCSDVDAPSPGGRRRRRRGCSTAPNKAGRGPRAGPASGARVRRCRTKQARSRCPRPAAARLFDGAEQSGPEGAARAAVGALVRRCRTKPPTVPDSSPPPAPAFDGAEQSRPSSVKSIGVSMDSGARASPCLSLARKSSQRLVDRSHPHLPRCCHLAAASNGGAAPIRRQQELSSRAPRSPPHPAARAGRLHAGREPPAPRRRVR
jgi:hypothetical protein